MTVSVLNSLIDTNTLLAISSEPDGCAIVGNLFQMISLAIHDPEGCVRLDPNSSMDPEIFSKYFNCAVSMVAKSIETLQKSGLIMIEDGKIYVTLLRGQKMKNETRDEKWNAPCNILENEENHNYNNYNNYNLLIKDKYNYNYNYAEGAEKTEGSCLPFCPGDHYDDSQMIPLEIMPLPARHVLEAWNRLKLKTFKGLYSTFAEKLYDILYKYGEEAFLKVIENVKNSPFLMGHNNTPNRWRVTFTWLLNVKNFLNVLKGKYNRPGSDGSSDSKDPGGDRNDTPLNLPGCESRTDLTPEERRQAYYEYMHPHNELLDGMARDFGVSY